MDQLVGPRLADWQGKLAKTARNRHLSDIHVSAGWTALGDWQGKLAQDSAKQALDPLGDSGGLTIKGDSQSICEFSNMKKTLQV